MKCPECDAQTEVKDSRPGADNTIRRRRRCAGCHLRFTTYEVVGTPRPYSEGWKDCLKHVAERSLRALILEEQKEKTNAVLDR